MGGPTPVIAFQTDKSIKTGNVGISFKIKPTNLTQVIVQVPTKEKTYNIADGKNLGNGWYEIKVPFTDFPGSNDAKEFGIYGKHQQGGEFYITDVALMKASSDTPVDPPVDPPVVPPATDANYFFSQTGTIDIASMWAEWGTGTKIDTVVDSKYSKAIKLTGASGWGTALAFPGLTKGLFAGYTNLEFKVKTSDFTKLQVKLPEVEKSYNLSSGTNLGDGWVQMSIPLSDFSSVVATAVEFAIFNNTEHASGKIMYLTDIALTGKKDVVTPPPVDPTEETGFVIPTSNLIANSTFDNMNSWSVWSEGRTTDSLVGGALQLKTTDLGDAWWKTQLNHDKINLGGKKEGTYRISFDIYADKATDMVVEFNLAGAGRTLGKGMGTAYGAAGNAASFDITTTKRRVWQDIELFGFNSNAELHKLSFGFGKVSGKSVPATVTIDNIRFERVEF